MFYVMDGVLKGKPDMSSIILVENELLSIGKP
jgi:hypothetical protein